MARLQEAPERLLSSGMTDGLKDLKTLPRLSEHATRLGTLRPVAKWPDTLRAFKSGWHVSAWDLNGQMACATSVFAESRCQGALHGASVDLQLQGR